MVEVLPDVANLVVAVAALVTALVALRFAREQARSYLYPAPAIFPGADDGAVYLRNFGGGAMLSISVDVDIHFANGGRARVYRAYSSLANNEAVVLLAPQLLASGAVLTVEASIRCENIVRRTAERKLTLTADQLAPPVS